MQTNLFASPVPSLNVRLTLEQSGNRKSKLWRAFLTWRQSVIKGFYPATGGSEHLMHNWHVCSNDEKDSQLGQWIFKTTWARYNRLADRLKARDAIREHKRHGSDFGALWCPFCNHND